jgi:catechol 2,3-dioxygenase-like lactoylglutathione lyase family enzyme
MRAMSLIPVVRCTDLASSSRFYEELLGLRRLDGGEPLRDPGFCVLSKGDDLLFLSSYAGDGVVGQALTVPVDDVDQVYAALLTRRLTSSDRKDSTVHERPIDQTWGTREFYVDDPDGNTIRFIQGLPLRR